MDKFRHSLSALENFFQKKHTHAGSIVNTTLPACYIYDLSPFLSNLIRASSVARTPSATTSPTTCLAVGANSPSKYSSTTLDGIPSRVSRLSPPSTYCRVFRKEFLCPLSRMLFGYSHLQPHV